jgi:hypothetical protein
VNVLKNAEFAIILAAIIFPVVERTFDATVTDEGAEEFTIIVGEYSGPPFAMLSHILIWINKIIDYIIMYMSWSDLNVSNATMTTQSSVPGSILMRNTYTPAIIGGSPTYTFTDIGTGLLYIVTVSTSGYFTPTYSGTIKFLLVGGGGGGGPDGHAGNVNGGGQGGKVVYNSSYSITAGTKYYFVVGTGGSSSATGGNSSTFDSVIIANGGQTGQNAFPLLGTGGNNATGGAAGGNAGSSSAGSNGVIGTVNSITGSPIIYASGGGGAGNPPGSGGAGDGNGNGGNTFSSTPPSNPGTYGSGGAGGYGTGGATPTTNSTSGANGVFIFLYSPPL